MTSEEQAEADKIAAHLMASALVEARGREAAYQARIAELTNAVESLTRSGVDNAKRYAEGLDREKRYGAEQVERIRVLIDSGGGDVEQRQATGYALAIVADPYVADVIMAQIIAPAYLAQGQALTEARSLLSEIGERALRLLGKGA